MYIRAGRHVKPAQKERNWRCVTMASSGNTSAVAQSQIDTEATRGLRARAHRTQAERREQTGTALRDATIDCLVEIGYARTSVQEICARAGVSKGAVQHHFSAKAVLMAAAVEHLTMKLRTQLARPLETAPGGRGGMPAALVLLWAG